MFIADILACICSGVALVYTLIHINFVARLPAKIMDTSLTAQERNVKLILFITMLVLIIFITYKLAAGLGKILFRQLYYKKLPQGGEHKGFFTKLFVLSGKKPFRIVSLWGSTAALTYVVVMLLIVYPNREYVVGTHRMTQRTINADLHRMWELNWFIPMLMFFAGVFVAGLLINALRYKIVSVLDEYNELYNVANARKNQSVTCPACGFENHQNSICCGDCEAALKT